MEIEACLFSGMTEGCKAWSPAAEPPLLAAELPQQPLCWCRGWQGLLGGGNHALLLPITHSLRSVVPLMKERKRHYSPSLPVTHPRPPRVHGSVSTPFLCKCGEPLLKRKAINNNYPQSSTPLNES